MKRSVQVSIRGQGYALRTDASQQEVAEVVEFTRQALDAVAAQRGAIDSMDTAVLALLNVVAAHLRLKRDLADQNTRITELLVRIEDALYPRQSGLVACHSPVAEHD